MDKRNGFTRWISIMLMVGLIVTSLPAGIGFGSEIVQNTIAEEKTSEDESNPAAEVGQAEPADDGKDVENIGTKGEEESDTDPSKEDSGADASEKNPPSLGDDPSGDGDEGKQLSGGETPQEVPLLDGGSQQYVEKRLELDADYVLCTSGEALPDSGVTLDSAKDSKVYMIFTRKSESPNDPFKMFFSIENITSVKLEFMAENKGTSKLSFSAYPLAVTKPLDIFNGLPPVKKISNDFLSSSEYILGSSKFCEENLYSIDLMNNITEVRGSSAINNINTAGYYGYALTLNSGEAIIRCRGTEEKPKLVVTYRELEEKEDDEISPEAIAAADRMLAARQAIQVNLKGSGTVSDPYLIYDADDLSGMVENDNACYKLMCDIDLKGVDWRPPGYYYWYPFMGYLDGNGYTIKNLHVGGTGNDAWDTNAGGLFGYFEGRVENLHIETVKAKRKGVDFFGYAGGIAGVANAPAEIINCSVNGYISGNTAVGGLVGIAYPGVIIESCCAIGSVDMSDAFAYINDNGNKTIKEIWDSGMDVGIYVLQWVMIKDEVAVAQIKGSSKGRAVFDAVWRKIRDFPLDSIFNTATQKGLRNCSLGGLTGVNYAYISNSYASVDLYNPQNPSTALFDWDGDGEVNDISDALLSNRLAKTGGLVGRNLSGYGATYNCFFNKDRYNNVNNSGQGEGKTTNDLKKAELFENSTTIYGKSADDQWDYKIKRKSTGGLPLPKKNDVSRVKKGDYEPDIYYDSRVLMKTRESFVIGAEVIEYDKAEYIQKADGQYYKIGAQETANSARVTDTDTIKNLKKKGQKTGAIYCTKCDELTGNQVAVTGRFQRGSDARPYHVHDLESLLAVQDSKESHFILCADIDFKVSNEEKTIQKYWWPAGKSHVSPIKGSLKGNVSYVDDKGDAKATAIYKNILTRPVTNKLERFTIKNLTVQSNRHTGFFASFRGTFSDINIQLSGKEGNADWRDGIIINTGNGEGKIAGLFTIGEKASVGAVAGETINGALIRNCIVTGPYRENNIPMNGRIKGSVRSGGIVGMNNRGSKIEGCEVLVEIDAENYEVNYQFDATGTGFDIYKAVIAQVDAVIVSVEGFIDLIQNPDPKRWRNNLKLGTTGLDSILMLVNGPVGTYLKGRYRNVCIGGIVGENYGTIGFGCISYTQSVIRKGALFKGWTMHHGVTIGRNNFYSSAQNIKTAEYQKPQQASAYSQSSPFMLYSSETTSGTLASAGSVTDPVIIRTEDDLKELMQAIRETGLRDTYVKQVKDIVLADNSEFKGFRGTFKGVYDGSGCTISGIASDKPLFENLDGAEIKNLGVKNSIFSAGAAIAGNVKDSIIQNCWIEETVSIGSLELSFAAGFADILEDSPIYNVYNYAQMQATTAVCGDSKRNERQFMHCKLSG